MLGLQAAPARRAWTAAALIALTFFAATAPTLKMLEFSSSMENLVVATSLEIRRTGAWLIPTLEGEPRVAKPPLAAWIGAAAIRSSTFAALDQPAQAERAAGYRSLAWDIRWPALLASCVMLLAVFDLGRTLANARIGLIAMIVCGSSAFLLRFGAQATTDVQLALWTTVANAAIARVLFQERQFPAAVVAGAALGLALMSKGPVAFLQTLLPAALFMAWRWRIGIALRIRAGHLIAAAILMILIGGGWYAIVAARDPNVWARWSIEVTRKISGERADHPLSYLAIFAYMLPWTPVLVHGLIWTAVEAVSPLRTRTPPSRETQGMVFALLLLIVPIITMSFVPDRKVRYLLPMAAPAALLAARGLSATLDPADPRRVPQWAVWATLLVMSVALCVAGTKYLRTVDGDPWYSRRAAAGIAVASAAIISLGYVASRSRPLLTVIGPACVMLLLQPIVLAGYRNSREGRSEMRPLAEMIRRLVPDARMYYWRPEGMKRASVDLAIYLNRPTRWIANPTALPPDEHPQVVVAQQPRGGPELAPPPGWVPLGQTPRDANWFHAFLRDTKSPSPTGGFAPVPPAE
jgi:4-amino-4-deoxy-L-arabinose transferase-like glycosyltransferase